MVPLSSSFAPGLAPEKVNSPLVTLLFRTLLLFSGPPRESDIPACLLLHLATKFRPHGFEVRLHVDRFDITLGKQFDASSPAIRFKVYTYLAKGMYDILVASPPCNTWSRAPWSRFPGPRPLRDHCYPLGFPWLKGKKKDKAAAGTGMALFACRSLAAALSCASPGHHWLPPRVLLEHPEDLGATPKGRPASIWPLPWTKDLLKAGASRGAVHQCKWKTPYPKPTGLLSNG